MCKRCWEDSSCSCFMYICLMILNFMWHQVSKAWLITRKILLVRLLVLTNMIWIWPNHLDWGERRFIYHRKIMLWSLGLKAGNVLIFHYKVSCHRGTPCSAQHTEYSCGILASETCSIKASVVTFPAEGRPIHQSSRTSPEQVKSLFRTSLISLHATRETHSRMQREATSPTCFNSRG